MKKIYLFLLVTVLAFAGSQQNAFAGSNCASIDSWVVIDPTSSLYPYGFVEGTFSGTNFLSGELYYEGGFLMNYESSDNSIFIFDLSPGSYEFIYCGGSIPFTVTGIPCDITEVSFGTLDVSGAGCTPNGSVDLTVTSSNPSAIYYYTLTNIITSDFVSGQDDGFGIISITGLSAGIYTLFVANEEDAVNAVCSYNTLVVINEPSCDMDIPTFSSNNASSVGGVDGSLSVSVTGGSCIPTSPGGNPIYNVYAELNGSYYADLVFNPNNGNYELTGLMAGTYTVVADNGGTTCFDSQDITVGENSGCNLPSPTINATNTTICNGSPAILGVPFGYDSYQWVYNGSFLITTGLVGTDPVYWAYLEGSYSCIVTDNGCTAVSNSVFVSAPLSPEINFPDTIYSCDNSVTLTAPAAFTNYLWSTLDTTESVTLTSDGWYGLAAGVDALVCGVVDSFYVSLNNTAPTANINVIGANPFCVGTSITLESSSSSNNLWSTNETTQSIMVSTTGNYSVTVSNTIGCTAVASVTVTAQTCVPSTQLSNNVCGFLSFVRTSAISCNLVSGATQYEWEFSNGNGVYATKLSPVNYLALHNVTPILNWGTTWSVRVRAIIGANVGVFGTPCTIGIVTDPALSGVATTKLRPQDCGKLNYRINNDNRIITLLVAGATQYEYEFTQVGAGTPAFSVTRVGNALFLNTVTPSLAFPAQYNVRTRARVGTTWGSYGDVCLIGIIGLNRDENAQELSYDADGNVIVEAPYFDLAAMPNPYSDITSVVINSSINENVYIQFFDMTGKIVEDMKVTTNERFNVGANLSKGIYLLKARSESGNQVTTRLVKTN
jgi:hypothetical protein